MKICLQTLATSMTLIVILLAGCVDPSTVKSNEVTPKPRRKTAKISLKNFVDLEYLATLKGVEYIELTREKKGGIPWPWEPLTVSVDAWKRRLERGRELLIGMRSKKITLEEYNQQALQIHREDGLVKSMQLMIELWESTEDKITRVVNLAYAENPDDFDTLLLWVLAGGNMVELYGAEKTAGTRRLYEMNPNHPWVLHQLAKCLLGTNPQEALGYAQKAQELDPRYLPLGVEGLCYFQMGDYQKALASFLRSHQNAVATSQPSYIIKAISVWVGQAEDVVNSRGEGEEIREKIRKAGQPILGHDLPTRTFR